MRYKTIRTDVFKALDGILTDTKQATGNDYTGQEWNNVINTYLTIRRLAKKHHRLAEMDCNGAGYVKGQAYYAGTIDDYAKRQYGNNVKSAYVIPQQEYTVFQIESDIIEDKIKALCAKVGFEVEFQGDPRGNTVKLGYKGRYIQII